MQKVIKSLTITIFVVIIFVLMTGCSKSKPVISNYFHKGVYESYSLDEKNPQKKYYYIFYDENSGHTKESELGIGLPFSCLQKDGYVKFKFAGEEEPEEIFKIKSVQNGIITGSFEDNKLLIFELLPNVNSHN